MLKKVSTPLGSVFVPPHVPLSSTLFYTGREFEGFITPDGSRRISETIRQLSGIETVLSTCHQVHGVAAALVEELESGWCELESCDALWTTQRGSALGIKVADCLPVTVIDSESSLLVNIHAGWRGTSAGIVAMTLDSIRAAGAIDERRAIAFLGPSIRRCCFEVGEEVVEAFGAAGAEFVDRSRGRAHIDIPAFTAALLEARGFLPERIVDSRICTRCDERFHSYRRGREKAGRNLAIVAQ